MTLTKVGIILLSIIYCQIASAWEYRESTDKMRGTKTKLAKVASTNKVNFGFPYNGGSKLTIFVRERSQDGLNVFLKISKGQFSCFDTCAFNVKFDDGSVEYISATGSDDGSSDTIFVQYDEKGFLSKLKDAKHVIIEADFFDSGSSQFDFNVKGLKW